MVTNSLVNSAISVIAGIINRLDVKLKIVLVWFEIQNYYLERVLDKL